MELLPCPVNQPTANPDALHIMIPLNTSLSLTTKVLLLSEISTGLKSIKEFQALLIKSKRLCSRKSRKLNGSKPWSSPQIPNISPSVPTITQFTSSTPKPTKSISSLPVTVPSSLLSIGLPMEVSSDPSVVLTNFCSSILVPRREIHQVLPTPLELFGPTKPVSLDGMFKVSSHQVAMVPISTLAP